MSRLYFLAGVWLLTVSVAAAQFFNPPMFMSNVSCRAATMMLLHFDGTNGSTTFTDSGAGANAPHTIAAVGTAQLNTGTVKFGTASLNALGTGNYATVTSATDLVFGAGDFTIDFWLNVSTANFALYSNRVGGSGTTTYLVWIDAGGHLAVNTTTGALHVGNTISASAWHHLAWTRSGSNNRMFVDGVTDGVWVDSSNFSSTQNFRIGSDVVGGTNDLNGFVDEFRVTKGTALWTANFTPPSTACN